MGFRAPNRTLLPHPNSVWDIGAQAAWAWPYPEQDHRPWPVSFVGCHGDVRPGVADVQGPERHAVVRGPLRAVRSPAAGPGRAPASAGGSPVLYSCRGLVSFLTVALSAHRLGGDSGVSRAQRVRGWGLAVRPSQLTGQPCCPADLSVRFEQAHVLPGTFAALVGGELQGRVAHGPPPGLLGAWCNGASGSDPTGRRCLRVPLARSQLCPLPPGGPSLDSRTSGCKTKSPSKGASPGCLRSAAAGLP